MHAGTNVSPDCQARSTVAFCKSRCNIEDCVAQDLQCFEFQSTSSILAIQLMQNEMLQGKQLRTLNEKLK